MYGYGDKANTSYPIAEHRRLFHDDWLIPFRDKNFDPFDENKKDIEYYINYALRVFFVHYNTKIAQLFNAEEAEFSDDYRQRFQRRIFPPNAKSSF